MARVVGTKTTLQVKSYIKGHPELISNTVAHKSRTPSPPQFINEVEVTNEDTVVHFTMSDIVNEAEIPASMEEVIPGESITLGLGWSTSNHKVKKPNRPRPSIKPSLKEPKFVL